MPPSAQCLQGLPSGLLTLLTPITFRKALSCFCQSQGIHLPNVCKSCLQACNICKPSAATLNIDRCRTATCSFSANSNVLCNRVGFGVDNPQPRVALELKHLQHSHTHSLRCSLTPLGSHLPAFSLSQSVTSTFVRSLSYPC